MEQMEKIQIREPESLDKHNELSLVDPSQSQDLGTEGSHGTPKDKDKAAKTPQIEGQKSGWLCGMPMAPKSTDARPLKVIGAGLGRTGTYSLKTALETLGIKTYHMVDAMKYCDFDFWVKVSEHETVDFNSVLGSRGFEASVDFPSAQYYKEQMQAFPDAKVILTTRDPEQWYNSCVDTIFQASKESGTSPLGFRVWMNLSMGKGRHKMIHNCISRDCFHDNWNKDNIIKCYLDHNAEVRRTVPPEKLLEIDITSGNVSWAPLCTFLGVPEPAADVPFPKVNDKADFQARIRSHNALGWVTGILLLGIPLIIEASSNPVPPEEQPQMQPPNPDLPLQEGDTGPRTFAEVTAIGANEATGMVDTAAPIPGDISTSPTELRQADDHAKAASSALKADNPPPPLPDPIAMQQHADRDAVASPDSQAVTESATAAGGGTAAAGVAHKTDTAV